jgi:hypothetical protein
MAAGDGRSGGGGARRGGKGRSFKPPGRRGGGRAGSGAYVQELGVVLRRRDPLALRDFLAASARHYGNEAEARELESREAAEMALVMHRSIVARPDLADIHLDSQRWLRAHGLDPDVTGESHRN